MKISMKIAPVKSLCYVCGCVFFVIFAKINSTNCSNFEICKIAIHPLKINYYTVFDLLFQLTGVVDRYPGIQHFQSQNKSYQ